MDISRQVTRLHTSGSGAALCRSWSSPHSLTQRMPSDRLMRAVLSNIDSWIDSLKEIEDATAPGAKSRVIHLRRNVLQAKLSFMRLTGASEDELEKAQREAAREAIWPES